jgi:cytochrome c biogenesis protein CcmG/thiol:disulfide interchange protein DsbE
MRRWLYLLPLALVLVLGGFFWWGLDPERNPNAIPSVLIGQPAPAFDLPPVSGLETPGLATADLGGGEPALVNVFASWCVPCRAEHAVLTRMARTEGVRLFGVNYKDRPQDAVAWLDELGNPYARIGADETGRAGIEWGLSGVPETFVVDAGGRVAYRHVGPIVTERDRTRLLEAYREAGA